MRNKNHPEGLPDVPAKHRRELRHANRLVQRMAYIVGAAHAAGSEYIIENPPHRGDANFDYLFMHAQHAALWQMPIIKTLTDAISAKLITFAQCMFGADSQKFTSFLHSSGFESSIGVTYTAYCVRTLPALTRPRLAATAGPTACGTRKEPPPFPPGKT